MVELKRISGFLDTELRVADFVDVSNNGVQVANSGHVRRVCCGVDASMELFEHAASQGADMVICHHGLSWGDSLKRITDINYRKVAFLMDNDMALYACHLPLDAHPRWGNNAQICRSLGLQSLKKFGIYAGKEIGFEGRFKKAMPMRDFKRLVGRVIGANIRTMEFGGDTVRTVGVVSGGASEEIEEAAVKGLDVFLSGEPRLAAYVMAQELGINAVFAGHYATEVFGVRALAGLLERKFRIKATFIDLKVPY